MLGDTTIIPEIWNTCVECLKDLDLEVGTRRPNITEIRGIQPGLIAAKTRSSKIYLQRCQLWKVMLFDMMPLPFSRREPLIVEEGAEIKLQALELVITAHHRYVNGVISDL